MAAVAPPLRIVLFGGTGTAGRAVLATCLADPGVESVLSISRKPTGATAPKLQEVLHSNFDDFTSLRERMQGYTTCFFCLGIASAGLTEEQYTRTTLHIPLAAARALVDADGPNSTTFIYLSGQLADSSEKGSMMWARVKGRAENELGRLPFKQFHVFRPGYIQAVIGPPGSSSGDGMFASLLRWLLPPLVTTNERIGQAMLQVARHGASTTVLENSAINATAAAYKAATTK